MPENFVTHRELEDKVDTLLILNDKTNERISDLKDSVSRQINLWGLVITAIAMFFTGMQIGIAVILYFLSK